MFAVWFRSWSAPWTLSHFQLFNNIYSRAEHRNEFYPLGFDLKGSCKNVLPLRLWQVVFLWAPFPWGLGQVRYAYLNLVFSSDAADSGVILVLQDKLVIKYLSKKKLVIDTSLIEFQCPASWIYLIHYIVPFSPNQHMFTFIYLIQYIVLFIPNQHM